MSNRIKELAYKAGYKPLEPKSFADDLQEVFLQKFADLIVQECAEIVASSSLPDTYSEPALEIIAEEIKDHFGVSDD